MKLLYPVHPSLDPADVVGTVNHIVEHTPVAPDYLDPQEAHNFAQKSKMIMWMCVYTFPPSHCTRQI